MGPQAPQQRPVRLLLVEDHALLRECLARSLDSEPGLSVVAQCGGVSEALEAIAAQPVDVVLLDLSLGPEQGGSFLNACAGAGFTGHVLIVTAGVGEREAAWLRKRGCSGIFLKQNQLADLVAMIRDVASRGSNIANPVGRRVGAAAGTDQKKSLALTPREREVLRGVCDGLLTKQIAARMRISEPSVKSYLQQLFLKSGVRTRAQLVRASIEQYWDDLGVE